MADVTVKVLRPADSVALLSLSEAKMMLGITDSSAASDQQLRFLIDVNSAVISAKCANRVFAKERVEEYWRELQPPRLFLTHWPVKQADIEKVEAPDGSLLTAADYQLEEASGKLLLFGSKAEPIKITYTGGSYLPDDAPLALKQATALLVGVGRGEQQRAALTGIRMIAHKEARVMFHGDTGSSGGASSGQTAAQIAVDNILSHFTRHWV